MEVIVQTMEVIVQIMEVIVQPIFVKICNTTHYSVFPKG